MSEDDARPLHRGSGGSTYTRKAHATREAPDRGQGWSNRTPVRDRPGAHGVAERLEVPRKPGNAGGGKEPADAGDRGLTARACRREPPLSRNTRIGNHVFTRPRSIPGLRRDRKNGGTGI